jgi:hypothetical protein
MVKITPNRTYYDPAIHITAGELRKLGFCIPETVSDNAFVRRVAVGVDGSERLGRRTSTVKLKVLEFFMEPRPYMRLTCPAPVF